MSHIRTGITIPVQSFVPVYPATQTNGKSEISATLVERLDAYQAPLKDVYRDAASNGIVDIPIHGAQPATANIGAARARRSTDGPSVPTSTSGSNSIRSASQPIVGHAIANMAATLMPATAPDSASAAPASRERVAGVPLQEDFGAELLSTFRATPLCTWQRADLIEQAFKEWNSEGPSPQAAKRLQKVLEPGYTDTPDERLGAVILDALALHLIDRGRYVPLVRDYIDSLKRSGDYESLVDALLRDCPDKTREWASNMVETTLLIWNEPLPVELRADDVPADKPAFDLEARILKLYRLMNVDEHIAEGSDDSE